MRRTSLALGLWLAAGPAPGITAAQERVLIDLGPDTPETAPPQRIDLTLPSPVPEEADEECEDRRDAGIVAGEIVVCRSAGEPTDGGWDQEAFMRRYAEATQGIKTPNMEVDPTPPMVGISVSAKFGDPPPAALMIDVTALPQAPPGSDADRVARGLPPQTNDD